MDCWNKGLEISFSAQSEAKVNDYEKMQEKIADEKRNVEYRTSGVPEKFWNDSFDTFVVNNDEEQYAKNIAVSFSYSPENKVLVFCGSNGVGKTHLATSIIREYGGEYITSSMLCLKYDSAIGYKAKMSREEIIEHYISSPLLVIDDCCKYFLNSDLEKFILLTIICGRYENGKPTVLVSNAKKKDFIDFLGQAVFDRFTEVCKTIEFYCDSKRKQRRQW